MSIVVFTHVSDFTVCRSCPSRNNSDVCVCIDSLSLVDWVGSVDNEPELATFWCITCHRDGSILQLDGSDPILYIHKKR